MAKSSFNKSQTKTPVSEQDPLIRATNFMEVTQGYNAEEAMQEACRCIGCPDSPCKTGCPVGVPIPEFIAQVAQGNFDEAYGIVKEKNFLPSVCGRVCPQENQCEGKCTRGRNGESVAIGRLERFVADCAAQKRTQEHREYSDVSVLTSTKKVACIGSGPASLTCAAELARAGIQVTVFEALHEAGGVLSYGIPEFRLPNELVKREVESIRRMGVMFELNAMVGKLYSIRELMDDQGFDAVFVGTGAGLPGYLYIEGEGLNGVMAANELLTRVNLMHAYRFPEYATPVFMGSHCAVVGGGNVAMDAARTAKRLGADVTIVYRRSKEEMPARAEEVHHAEEEGIHFCVSANPVRAIGNEEGWITHLECERMEPGPEDETGRRFPVPVPDSLFSLEVDMLVEAVGNKTNPLLAETTEGLKATDRHLIIVDDVTCATSVPGVFAGGDSVIGSATVIMAMGAGKRAAKGIREYLNR